MIKDEQYYDKLYLQGGYNKMYHKHYMESPYLKIWKKALEIIKEIREPKLIEIGCGSGQFANLLFDNKFIDYKGIDYSQEAINLAKRNNSLFTDHFSVDNSYQSQVYQDQYNVVVLFEVLEHLSDDLLVLNKIRSGSHVLFSVPNFDSESHVRFFNSENDIINRYGNVVQIDEIYTFKISKKNVLYLVKGIKK